MNEETVKAIVELVEQLGIYYAVIILFAMSGIWMWKHFRVRYYEARLDNLKSLQSKRVEQYDGLWDAVGGICTPYVKPKMSGYLCWTQEYVDPADIPEGNGALDRVVLLEAFTALSSWYQKHGIFLDSESRLWTLLLREKCAQVLHDTGNSVSSIPWKENEWPRLWLIKTALRISLESAISVPGLEGKRHRAWPPQKRSFYNPLIIVLWLRDLARGFPMRRLADQLKVKFEIVDVLSKHNHNEDKRKKMRKTLIKQVIKAFASGDVRGLMETGNP